MRGRNRTDARSSKPCVEFGLLQRAVLMVFAELHAGLIENNTPVYAQDVSLRHAVVAYFDPPDSITFTCCRTLAICWPLSPLTVTLTS